MPTDENYTITSRIDRIRLLIREDKGSIEWLEAASLAQSVLHDTIGGAHPLMATLNDALKSKDGISALAASRVAVTLYTEGALKSPRLTIAGEIEGEILDIAQAQVQAAEIGTDTNRKQLQLAIAAFLTGAALEDALRRLSDAHGIQYDAQKTSISKLQTVLFQPSKQIEVISSSENKQITVWGDTRNKADHGKFEDITYTEVVSMVLGVRAFIERHLPS